VSLGSALLPCPPLGVGTFARSLLDHLGGRAGADPAADLVSELEGGLRRARASWPGVHVDDDVFARELASRFAPEDDLRAALRSLSVDDVYLVVACASGDGAALAAFERVYVPMIRATLRGMGLSPTLTDETTQVMRDQLLVAVDGARARVLDYGGRGAFRAWLRPVAARTAQRLLRGERGTDVLRESMTAAADDDLELGYLKRQYTPVFHESFREALAGIPAKDRLLLKQRLRHRLSLEDLASLYGVHEGTISRRVGVARDRLVSETRDAMMRRLNLGRPEVSSILRLIYSEIDVTLSTVT
jgi:RNA polymerase sigma-70 factor, ECF subfamily